MHELIIIKRYFEKSSCSI